MIDAGFCRNLARYNSLQNNSLTQQVEVLVEATRRADSDGDIGWYFKALKRDVHKSKWPCVQHFVNHKTQHRGQVRAMPTAAGAHPRAADLFIMPETV